MYLSGLLPLTLLGLASAGAVKRQSQSDPDFSGTGNIFVINGHDFATEDPNNIAGCITATGRFVSDTTKCGVFTAPSGKMSSTAGPCTFLDPTAEVGPPMAPQFYAFKCSPTSTQGNLFYSFVSSDPPNWSDAELGRYANARCSSAAILGLGKLGYGKGI